MCLYWTGSSKKIPLLRSRHPAPNCSEDAEEYSLVTILTLSKTTRAKRVSSILQSPMFKLALSKRFPATKNWCDKTILSVLKKDLQLSFKKMHKIKKKTASKESIGDMLKWGMLIQKLSDSNFELIYFDEFWVSTRSMDHKGWSK